MAGRTIVSDAKHATRLAKDGHPQSPVAIRTASRLAVDTDRNGAQSHSRVLLDNNLEEDGYDRSSTAVAPSGDRQQQYQVTGPDQSHVAPETLSGPEQPSLPRRIVTMSAKAGDGSPSNT